MKKKLVLTGAAGRLGGYLRGPLSQIADTLVSTDLAPSVENLAANETYVQADLSDLEAMKALTKGADMVVHFGAIGDEAPFDDILKSNIVGAYNVWEAAHLNGLKRVVYASSIHAVGMHPKTKRIDTEVAHRPDTYYGLAKCFAEDLGSLYWDKRGLESVCMRILSCAKVNNARALGSWLSYGDLERMVKAAIDTPVTGFSIVYGVSNNDRAPVDNHKAHFLGYKPQDNAEVFAEEVLANEPPANPHDPAAMCHGGPFATVELGHSGTAGMNIEDELKG